MKEEIINVDERSNLLEAESTTNYGLIKPGQDDFYNVDEFNQNMDTIDQQLKVNENQIKNLESKVQNIDVSGDVRQVINERVNADTSKPLSTLISEWVNTAKTALLNAVSTLTTHVTSQHTATKNHVTTKVDALPQKSVWTDARGAKLDMLDQGIIKTQSNINGYIVTARDNIKSHMTSLMASPKVVKSVQRGAVSLGPNEYKVTVNFSSVNIAKAIVILNGAIITSQLSSDYTEVDIYVKSFSSTSMVIQSNKSGNGEFSWQIIEFY